MKENVDRIRYSQLVMAGVKWTLMRTLKHRLNHVIEFVTRDSSVGIGIVKRICSKDLF